ncbi:neuropeptide Y receptor type 6 isoform X1 [Strongylocentrotus purpuratus]|uniref:G-protein coupled receptors family 1 profile domain-containing protein n=1 Tax=Strongylocentrotus purpuratus TaxID=7668 RepID=A0A7M7PK25_STRPU|nr:neuropeptide Y receptor type 6 isoform X1 [Strongylocentrotus purpuratus]
MGRAKRVITALWLASCIFSSPAIFSKKVTAHYWEEELEPYSYTCNNAWPSEAMSIIYSVYLFLLLFFVPLLIVSYAYMRIACHLNSTRERSSGESNGSPFNRPVLSRYRVWYRNTSGWSSGSSFVRRAEAASQANGVTIDDDTTEADALRSEPSRVENLNDSPAPRRHRGTSEGDKIQRVITMLAIVVALFILSWGPLLTYTLIYRFIDDMPYNTHAVLSLFLHLLAACNSCVNPIIYAFLSKNFRQSFKQTITCHTRKRRRSKRRRLGMRIRGVNERAFELNENKAFSRVFLDENYRTREAISGDVSMSRPRTTSLQLQVFD